jgi:hypothetical protein
MNIAFSEESYRDFLNQKYSVNNTRIRPDNESIWDALLSEQADFTKTADGKHILEVIKNLGE